MIISFKPTDCFSKWNYQFRWMPELNLYSLFFYTCIIPLIFTSCVLAKFNFFPPKKHILFHFLTCNFPNYPHLLLLLNWFFVQYSKNIKNTPMHIFLTNYIPKTFFKKNFLLSYVHISLVGTLVFRTSGLLA